eukprot:109438-Amorphochlora_amoeboformis.AAC.1
MVLQTCPVREVQTEAVETLYRLINIRFGVNTILVTLSVANSVTLSDCPRNPKLNRMDYFCANAKDKDGDHLTTITALALSLPKLSHK